MMRAARQFRKRLTLTRHTSKNEAGNSVIISFNSGICYVAKTMEVRKQNISPQYILYPKHLILDRRFSLWP